MNMKKETKNNKGFSLIELIIVIAIMAVLIGVLAPAYLRYVERSRQSSDIQAISTAMGSMRTAAADPRLGIAANDTMSVTFSPSNDVAFTALKGGATGTANDKAKKELEETVGTGYRLRSQTWGAGGGTVMITGTVTANGNVTFVVKSSISNDMSKNIVDSAEFGKDVTPDGASNP